MNNLSHLHSALSSKLILASHTNTWSNEIDKMNEISKIWWDKINEIWSMRLIKSISASLSSLCQKLFHQVVQPKGWLPLYIRYEIWSIYQFINFNKTHGRVSFDEHIIQMFDKMWGWLVGWWRGIETKMTCNFRTFLITNPFYYINRKSQYLLIIINII